MRWFLVLPILALAACERSPEPVAGPGAGDGGGAVFREVAAATGLEFEHFIGSTGEYYFPETAAAGLAVLDYDGDGDLDVYMLQGHLLDESKSLRDAKFPPPKRHFPGNRLFRNELVPGGSLGFADVTEEAGVGHEGYGMGAAVGDYDNDGDPDLYVTNFGSNRDGIGARVAVLRDPAPALWRRVRTDGSYLSANDVRVHFGLGGAEEIAGVRVEWPGGESEVFRDVAVNGFVSLRQGSGEPVESDAPTSPPADP